MIMISKMILKPKIAKTSVIVMIMSINIYRG